LVRFNQDPHEDLLHGLAMEEVTIQSDALVDTYFASPVAENLMPQLTVAQSSVAMKLSNSCPIPTAWAPYFLDLKTPFEALQMKDMLVATMTDVGNCTQAAPLLGLLQGCCVQLGTNGTTS
jgi:hypothetical protein